MSVMILGRKEVSELLDMPSVIESVKDAFIKLARGSALMPAKVYLELEKGDFRAMPSALPDSAGIKWVNVHPGNLSLGLPTVMAIYIYNDPDTGRPLAVMDATDITAFRTGAASAIASSLLARKGSKTLGIVGAGRQAYTQIQAHNVLFDLENVSVYDLDPEKTHKLASAMPGLPVEAASIEQVCSSDILCTITPARKPVISSGWIKPGTHINAVGADAPGKQELDTEILLKARVIVDDLEQASKAGEINVAVKEGRYSLEMVGATLAEVVTGNKTGRTDNNQVTIFDSTGIAIEDLAVARIIYSRALKSGRQYPSMDS